MNWILGSCTCRSCHGEEKQTAQDRANRVQDELSCLDLRAGDPMWVCFWWYPFLWVGLKGKPKGKPPFWGSSTKQGHAIPLSQRDGLVFLLFLSLETWHVAIGIGIGWSGSSSKSKGTRAGGDRTFSGRRQPSKKEVSRTRSNLGCPLIPY